VEQHTYKRRYNPDENIHRFKPVFTDPTKGLTFTQKQHLIMVGDERLHRMEGPCWSDGLFKHFFLLSP
jgi:hypothetical protein